MSSQLSQNIIDILEALKFNEYLAKRHKIIITHESFEKLQPHQFRVIFYFLFEKLMPEKTRSRFRSVYPSLDPKQEAEFRQITIELLNEINSRDQNCKFGRILPIYFQRLSGQQFFELVFRFANYVLSKVVNQKAKAFPNLNIVEESLGKWSTTVELNSKIMDFDARVLQHDAQIEKYTNQLNSINEKINANVKVVEIELVKYAPYKSADFLEKYNQHLEQKVVELSKFIENSSGQLKASTNDSISSVGTRDKLLITELVMVDRLTKFIKRNHEQLLANLKQTSTLKNLCTQQQAQLERADKTINLLKENLAQVKGELFQTKPAKVALEEVKAYFKPLFDTPLTFEAYSPGLHLRINEYLKRVTDKGQQNL